MRLHGYTWAALVAGLLVLLAANLWCWRPGIGLRPEGTEVELFYGWPATYQAEWWASEDQDLGPAFLATAPFFYPPEAMGRRASYAGLLPALADVAFGVAALGVVGVCMESLARGAWHRRQAIGLVIAGALLALVWVAANGISVHL